MPQSNYQSRGYVNSRQLDTNALLTSADSFMIRRPSGVKLSAPVIRVSYSLSARSGIRLIALLRIQSMKEQHRSEFDKSEFSPYGNHPNYRVTVNNWRCLVHRSRRLVSIRVEIRRLRHYGRLKVAHRIALRDFERWEHCLENLLLASSSNICTLNRSLNCKEDWRQSTLASLPHACVGIRTPGDDSYPSSRAHYKKRTDNPSV